MRFIDGLLAGVAAVLPIAALLLLTAALVPGGTLMWTRGLWFLAVYVAISGAGNVALAMFRLAHFRVRQQGVVAEAAKKQPKIDTVGSVIFLAYASAWLVFIPVDVFRLHLLPAPCAAVSALGGAMAAYGAAISGGSRNAASRLAPLQAHPPLANVAANKCTCEERHHG